MNNSIEKARAKYQKKQNNKLRKWWLKNDYKVLRVLFFYIWFPCWLWEKYKDYSYTSTAWSSEKAKKYLDMLVPYLTRCDEQHEEILFTDADDMGGIQFYWSFSRIYKNKYRKAKDFIIKFNNKVKEYIINEYQIDGYKKMTVDSYKLWNEAVEKFGWYSSPYHAEHRIGVIFYIETEK